jgi:hypothetical protein
MPTSIPLVPDEQSAGQRRAWNEMFTGGTTGRGIVICNHTSNMEERFAVMDLFWARYGFTIGRQRISWFSGRTLIEEDVDHHRFCGRTGSQGTLLQHVPSLAGQLAVLRRRSEPFPATLPQRIPVGDQRDCALRRRVSSPP